MDCRKLCVVISVVSEGVKFAYLRTLLFVSVYNPDSYTNRNKSDFSLLTIVKGGSSRLLWV